MKHTFKQAFTLVELIVVITILAVLATVAFISFQGYTSSSRDSVRLADLKNISKSFELNRTKGIDFPLPDKKVDISSSGTIFQYQGELSQNILNSDLNIFDGGVDPLTGENYGYAVNAARNKFQVIGFLENSENIANISLNKSFADNLDKYVKSSGDNLGILLDETNNEIVNSDSGTTQIDIITTSNNYALVVNNKIETGGSEVIKKITGTQFQSCKDLLEEFPYLSSGEYVIGDFGAVYCDMDFNGGGWTAIGKYKNWSPSGDVNFIEVGNSIVSQATEFAALTFDTQGDIFASHTAQVNYDGKNKWYLDNYDNSNTTERFANINTVRLGYGVYQKNNIVNKYKGYGNGYSILNFSEFGMDYRLHTQTANHARYSSGIGCIVSSYVAQGDFPFGTYGDYKPTGVELDGASPCSASYNPYTIGLMFR